MGAEVGMRVVETIAKIRRAYFAQGLGIKAICRELGVSRKVACKVIRSGASAFHYERGAQPLPKIGPWRDKLDQLLATNEGKAARERLTLIRLYEALKEFGYAGGYDAVRRYAGRWRRERGRTTANARDRRRRRKALLLHQQFERPKAPAAGRDFIHAGLGAAPNKDRADRQALKERPPRDLLSELLDRDARLHLTDVGLGKHELVERDVARRALRQFRRFGIRFRFVQG
jgi:hypothetical protein